VVNCRPGLDENPAARAGTREKRTAGRRVRRLSPNCPLFRYQHTCATKRGAQACAPPARASARVHRQRLLGQPPARAVSLNDTAAPTTTLMIGNTSRQRRGGERRGARRRSRKIFFERGRGAVAGPGPVAGAAELRRGAAERVRWGPGRTATRTNCLAATPVPLLPVVYTNGCRKPPWWISTRVRLAPGVPWLVDGTQTCQVARRESVRRTAG